MSSPDRFDIVRCDAPQLAGRIGVDEIWVSELGLRIHDRRNGMIYVVTVDQTQESPRLSSIYRRAAQGTLQGATTLSDARLEALALGALEKLASDPEYPWPFTMEVHEEADGADATHRSRRPSVQEVARQARIAASRQVSLRSHFHDLYGVAPSSVERWVKEARIALGERAVPMHKPGRRPKNPTATSPVASGDLDPIVQQQRRDARSGRSRSTKSKGGTR